MNLVGLIFILVYSGLLILFVIIGRKQKDRKIRELPAFSGLRRMVGLAVEAGTRIHVSLGRGGMSGVPAAATLTGLTVLDRVARAASMSDRPPFATSGEGTETILSQDTLWSAYQSVHAANQYNPTAGRLTGLTPFSYAAGTLPIIHDEQVSTNLLVGHFGSEISLLVEGTQKTGSSLLAGSDQLSAQAVLYAATPDALVGEEFYAAGAYLGAGPVHVASLHAQDILRWILIGVMLVGALAKLVGLL